jgi:ribosomal protein L37E
VYDDLVKLKALLCTESCEGAPKVGLKVVKHWHITCWMCGGEAFGHSARSYSCKLCDYSQGPGIPLEWAKHAYPDYDPEFAANSSSPGLYSGA